MERAIADLALVLVAGLYAAAIVWGLREWAKRIWGPPPERQRRRRPF